MGIDITDRKTAETHLKESEERYKRLVDGSPDILYSFSKGKGGFYVSAKVEEVLGYTAEYLMENPFVWYESIHPEDREAVDRALSRCAEGEHFKIEYRIRNRDGNWLWFYDRSIGLRMEEDGACLIEGLAMDITDRKKAEERFETFFSLIYDIFCIADIDGHFRLINPAAERILGYTREELYERPFMEFIHPDDRENTLQVIRERLAHGATVVNFQNRYICKDGSVRWLEWNSQPMLDQGITFAVGRDCTRRRAMEASVRESEIWLRNIYNSLEEAVLVVSPDRSLVNVNRASLEMFGYTEQELLNLSTELLHVDTEYFREFGRRIEKAFDQGISAEFEFQARRKNGEIFPTEHTVSLLRDESGKPLGIVSVVRDISERKKAEAKFKEIMGELGRSNLELEQFAYVASHDLQEPLRAIAGFLQLLQDRFGDRLDEKGHHYIERSVNAANRMQALINDLLKLSRISTKAAELKDTDLNAVLERTLEGLETVIHETGARITRNKLPCVAVDANQIQSLLQNLIQNAIKYVGDHTPDVEIGCEEDSLRYRIHVKDNGIGIDPKFHERIFLVFQRLHTRKEYPGTGLGLALCRKIVERHKGRIWVESRPEEGSTFYFTLPKTETTP